MAIEIKKLFSYIIFISLYSFHSNHKYKDISQAWSVLNRNSYALRRVYIFLIFRKNIEEIKFQVFSVRDHFFKITDYRLFSSIGTKPYVPLQNHFAPSTNPAAVVVHMRDIANMYCSKYCSYCKKNTQLLPESIRNLYFKFISSIRYSFCKMFVTHIGIILVQYKVQIPPCAKFA